MKIFITGATGYIGSAVTAELVKSAHQVLGLARSSKSEAAVKALGAQAVKGDLDNPASYESAASLCEVLIHIAFDYGDANGKQKDKKTVETLIKAAQGGKTRSLIYTSGVLVLGDTGDSPADESHPADKPAPAVAWRPGHEKMILNAATSTLAASVIRPGFVWGGNKGNFGQWFDQTEKNGAPLVVGDGKNRRAYVHKNDLAEFYRLVIERHASGVFHAVDGASPRVRDAASECSKLAGGKGEIKTISVEEASKLMGGFAPALTIDQVVATKRSKELGWNHKQPIYPQNIAAAYKEFRS